MPGKGGWKGLLWRQPADSCLRGKKRRLGVGRPPNERPTLVSAPDVINEHVPVNLIAVLTSQKTGSRSPYRPLWRKTQVLDSLFLPVLGCLCPAQRQVGSRRHDRSQRLSVDIHSRCELEPPAGGLTQRSTVLLIQLPAFSANNLPAHVRETGRENSPGAALRADGRVRSVR